MGSWIMEDQYEKVYKKFLVGLENRNTPSLLRAPESPPDWLDKEACRKGREYYFSYSAATSISSMEALLLGFCIPNFYKPLIVSRKSHMKEDATTRYLETAALVYSWYLTDVWERESLSSVMIRRVNAMHRFVANKVRPIHKTIGKNVQEVFKDADVDLESELTEQDRILLEEITEIREKTVIPQEYYNYVNDSVAFSQVDMTLVQGAFFGQLLLFPEHYGAKNVTSDEIRNFLIFWRTNGYYLGMDYHVVMYAKYELCGIPLPKLWASLSMMQKAKYYLRQAYIPHIYPLPGVRQTINYFARLTLSSILDNYQKKGKTPKTSG